MKQQPSEVRALIRAVRQQGGSVETTSRHLRFRDPAGMVVAIGSSTPSDPRSVRNLTAALRRGGFTIRRK